jgi:hypothetical protein
MKRILLILMAVLFISGMAFSVSGRIFVRYGCYFETSKSGGTLMGKMGATQVIGPLWSFWGVPNNVDLWQNQPGGTGFEVNFDNFGLLYKTRDQLPAEWFDADGVLHKTELAEVYNASDSSAITTFSYNDRFGPSDNLHAGILRATSPGYFQINKLNVFGTPVQIGIAWWEIYATDKISNSVLSGADSHNERADIGFSKFYVDFKANYAINDSIIVKIVDWDLIWSEFYFGKFSDVETSGSKRTNSNAASGFKIYVPLRIFWSVLDNLNLDIAPKLIYDTKAHEWDANNGGVIETNKKFDNYLRLGSTVRVSYGINDMLTGYLMTGYYFENEQEFDRTLTPDGLINTNFLINSTYNTIPIYAGVKLKLSGTITFNLGYGVSLSLNSRDTVISGSVYGATTNVLTYGTVLRTGYMMNFRRWDMNWDGTGLGSADHGDFAGGASFMIPERQTYGDNLMDTVFLRMAGVAKFAQNWELSIASAVSLNDPWTVNYINMGSDNESFSQGNAGFKRVMFNWLVFNNFSSYDNNMYLKYEDDVVAIKGSVGMFPYRQQLNQILKSDNIDKKFTFTINDDVEQKIFGFFTYMDFSYKF